MGLLTASSDSTSPPNCSCCHPPHPASWRRRRRQQLRLPVSCQMLAKNHRSKLTNSREDDTSLSASIGDGSGRPYRLWLIPTSTQWKRHGQHLISRQRVDIVASRRNCGFPACRRRPALALADLVVSGPRILGFSALSTPQFRRSRQRHLSRAVPHQALRGTNVRHTSPDIQCRPRPARYPWTLQEQKQEVYISQRHLHRLHTLA